MLKSENSIPEIQWQNKILEFIIVLLPKYVAALHNVEISDFYSRIVRTPRFIDIALIDANGNLDIIEIKKPSEDLLSQCTYRDNFVPKRNISGTIMQAEKYLFHLSKWGINGERELTKKQIKSLPLGMKIKITNPKAILIAGRSNKFSDEQKSDFEIFKRKYANIVDIISYDDLLFRLENIIKKFKKLSGFQSIYYPL